MKVMEQLRANLNKTLNDEFKMHNGLSVPRLLLYISLNFVKGVAKMRCQMLTTVYLCPFLTEDVFVLTKRRGHSSVSQKG